MVGESSQLTLNTVSMLGTSLKHRYNPSNSSGASQLSIVYYQGLASYKPTDPDIICVKESWLSDDIEDVEISLPGYSCSRLDRNRCGGGLVIY